MSRKKTSIIWTISNNEFSKVVSENDSYAGMLRHFGLCKGNNINTLKRRIKHDGLDISHVKKGHNCNTDRKFFHRRKTKEEFINENLIRDSKNSTRIKSRIIKFDLMEYKCKSCGLSDEWNGSELVLQLDHINGVSNDNRLENLRFLCPNCHSQTSTFAGRGFRKIHNCKQCGKVKKTKNSDVCAGCQSKNCRKFEVEDSDLIKLVCDEKLPYTEIGNRFGVSDNAIRKRVKSLGVDVKTRKLLI